MKTYKHSGTLGDLIYSLPIVKKMGGGEFKIALDNIEATIAKYSRNPAAIEQVDPAHRGRFTPADVNLLRPLLERQSYINTVSTWRQGDADADIDLDQFRGTLFRGFEGNYVQAYHMAFGLPFKMEDFDTPWLEADANPVAPIVVNRTPRYRCPSGDASWQNIAGQADLEKNGIFVGGVTEHSDFVASTGISIPYRPVRDFLELANIVAGADLVMANQSFVYSIAVGLGKSTLLETIKIKPLENNECFFPRTNCEYF